VRHRHIQRVLPASDDFVCPMCLGGRNPGYVLCDACDQVQGSYEIPRSLWASFVAVTTAIQGHGWHTRLTTYAHGRQEYLSQLATITRGYLNAHEGDIRRALGGKPEALVVVPSRRIDAGGEADPLVALADLARPMGLRPRDSLTYRGGGIGKRRRPYHPEEYEPGPNSVAGRRVLLLSDVWVTGGTLLSASAALLEHGASAVLPVAIARHASASAWKTRTVKGGPHPYWSGIREPWDRSHWPRG
jgi:hypothetical protein